MELSKRLQMIADSVPRGTHTVVDVGTDHGYIPIYLIKNAIAKHCIASDINANPLNNAKSNIHRYQMNDSIDTRLGTGLSKVAVGEVDVIIIAGMGGMLIIDILRDDLDLVKAVGLLILQAQSDIPCLRKYLHEINFSIVNEKMLYEDGKYYTIIMAKPGAEKAYSDLEYLLGQKLIMTKSPVLKDFLAYKIENLNQLIISLSNKNTNQTQKRLQEIKNENELYKEVILCL